MGVRCVSLFKKHMG